MTMGAVFALNHSSINHAIAGTMKYILFQFSRDNTFVCETLLFNNTDTSREVFLYRL